MNRVAGLTRRVAGGVIACALVWCSSVTGVLAGQPGGVEEFLGRSRTMMQGNRFSVRPGDWVAYRVIVTAGVLSGLPRTEFRVKISIPIHTNLEQPLEQDHQWVEFEFSDASGKDNALMVLKMLVKGDPRDRKAIQRMFIRAHGRIPMELPLKGVSTEEDADAPCVKGDQAACAAKGGKIRHGETKKTYTKMGWLEATRVWVDFPNGKGRSETWLSERVPLFGMVRSSAPPGLQLELDAYGGGALSRIDETKAVPIPDLEELYRKFPELKGGGS